MKGRIREMLCNAGLFRPARELAERARVLRRLLLPAPPMPLHRSEDIAPFFIVGSGRCGTTLLRRMLMAGGEVYIPPENWHLVGSILDFRQHRWALDWENVVRLTVNKFACQGEDAEGKARRWFDGQPLHPIIEQLKRLTEDERSLARVIDRLYQYSGHVREKTFTRWGDKTPMNVGTMQVILSVFPKAKFIHMLRDGTDVVHSWLKMDRYSTVREPALRWKTAVKEARRFKHEHSHCCREVRYEDLVHEPAATVEETCQFLDVTFHPQMVDGSAGNQQIAHLSQLSHHENAFEPVSSSHIGKGHRALGDQQKEQVADLIGKELRGCGYALP
jgi:hypothetical protein